MEQIHRVKKQGTSMRDFNSGNGDIHVGRDVTIYDESHNVHYSQYTNEVLFKELPFRKGNFKIEQKEKVGKLFKVTIVGVVLILGACGWAYFQGNANLLVLGIGGLGAFTSLTSIKFMIEPNEFQRAEQQAVKDILYVLKSRRAI